MCEPETALETPYDNRSSTLGAENVQDAVDELAARPVAEAPLAGRLFLRGWNELTDPTTPNVIVTSECDSTAIAISVQCQWVPPDVSPFPALTSSYADDPAEGRGATCIWSTPDQSIPGGTFRARALCLRL
jgi:hypothetical protein